jgi:FdhE protein
MTATDRPAFKGRIGDPTRGIGRFPTIILPDPANLFARRAERLDALAQGHLMEAWLRFAAGLARAQHAAIETIPPLAAPPADQPPLDAMPRDAAWRDALRGIVRSVNGAPPQARDVCAALLDSPAAEQEALADAYLQRSVPPAQTGAALFVAVALQAWFACCAASLSVDALAPLPQQGRCPACGGAPVAGVVTAGGAAPGARFLHCGLCATSWNHVRALCIGCGESGGLALQQIEGGGQVAKAETCNLCQGYLKLFYEANDMAVEPLADDMASLGLDMLVSEAGFARFAPSPLVIGG